MNTIDEYIAQFEPEIQEILQAIRKLIHEVAPDAIESISYQMPAFSLNKKPLAYFAVFKRHIGFYPAPIGIDEFKQELSIYKQGKGSVQFPLNKPIPFDLIEKIARFRKETIKKMEVNIF
jgi:uncharacterized protein YdhG (YjbR/CyaY superfamily)